MLYPLSRQIHLRIILNSHSHVAVECLFFEVGVWPLKYEIMRRRLMYLWKLLNVDKSELIHRIYKSQENASHPGDWVRLVQKDKQDLDLDIQNSEIEKLSKNKFKNVIDKKIESFALNQLNQLKAKHSKSDYLMSTSFQTSRYLVDSRSTSLRVSCCSDLEVKPWIWKWIFQTCIKIHCVRLVDYFKNLNLTCFSVRKTVPQWKMVGLKGNEVDENLIYSNIDNQLKVVKIYTQIMQIRKNLLDHEEPEEDWKFSAICCSDWPVHVWNAYFSCAAITVL